jgi:hypothetical protein
VRAGSPLEFTLAYAGARMTILLFVPPVPLWSATKKTRRQMRQTRQIGHFGVTKYIFSYFLGVFDDLATHLPPLKNIGKTGKTGKIGHFGAVHPPHPP